MNYQILEDIIQQIFNSGKTLLALNESNGNCNEHFTSEVIPESSANTNTEIETT